MTGNACPHVEQDAVVDDLTDRGRGEFDHRPARAQRAAAAPERRLDGLRGVALELFERGAGGGVLVGGDAPRAARCDRWSMAARKSANRPSIRASGAHAWARSRQILDAPVAPAFLSISGTLFILRKKPSVAGPAKVRFGPILGHRELPRGSHATPPVPTDAPGSGDVHRHPDLHLAAPWSDLRVDPWWRPIQPPEASSRWAASELRRSILTATRGGWARGAHTPASGGGRGSVRTDRGHQIWAARRMLGRGSEVELGR